MPKNKRESSGSSSDTSVHDSPPPAKKNKPADSKSSSAGSGVRTKGEVTWNLSNNKLVKVRTFKGKTYIDIREYYEKDGELMPGKKGISLTPELFQKLKNIMGEINEELNRC